MTDPLELNGDEKCMIYRLHYIGGPDDGIVANAFRPYFQTVSAAGLIYRAEEKPPDHEIWVDDFTRDIYLKWVPE